jgi:multidrug resistance efflux pump
MNGGFRQLSLCEERLERLKRLDDELPAKVRLSVGVELAETRVKRVKDELSSLEEQCESLAVTSPSHGVVGSVHHESGSLVTPGDAVVELFDDDRRHLIASIPSSAVAKLKPGTKLTLIFPSRSKRIGLVATIPPQAMRTDDEQDDDSQVAVKIEPAGKLWPKVPIGSRVKVQVPQ